MVRPVPVRVGDHEAVGLGEGSSPVECCGVEDCLGSVDHAGRCSVEDAVAASCKEDDLVLDPLRRDRVGHVGKDHRSHRQASGVHFFAEAQHKSFHQGYIFLGRSFDGTSKYETRSFEDERGPLMTRPGWNAAEIGFTTDWRKPWSLDMEFESNWGDARNDLEWEVGVRWNQSENFSHWIGFEFGHYRNDAQWVHNFRSADSTPPVVGIGGVDYVFGELDQKVWDITLRSNILFNRDNSLQLYLQPFLTRGNYSQMKWLATPDSYDLRPYDIDPSQFDFEYGAVNLNLVYRWEYRPGSTLYLVWAHNKNQYQEKGGPDNPDWDPDPVWKNEFDSGYPFRTEPGNTFMAKISYWFSI